MVKTASNGFAQGTYVGMAWSARRIKGAWKFKTGKPIAPGAKANIAFQINQKMSGGI